MRVPILAILLILSSTVAAQADSIVVYNTFPHTTAGGYGFGPLRTVAVQFTAAETGTLSLAELALRREAIISDAQFGVSIAADSGNFPGSVLEAWSVPLASVPLSATPLVTPPLQLASSLSPLLTAGTAYWLIVSTPADFPIVPPVTALSWTLSNALVGPHFILSSFSGGPLSVVTPGLAPGFRLTAEAADPIPEPGTVSLLALGLIGIARMARSSPAH